MYFFTDISTNASNLCLLNINKFDDKRKNNKKIIFIDPGVNELKTHSEYKYINKLHFLANNHLKQNEFISIDYPCDMVNRKLPKTQYDELCKLFKNKSIENNWKYAKNPQYICTVQSGWMEYNDFVTQMKLLEPIYAYNKKIVGLGNLCRLLLGRRKKDHPEYQYFQKVINYVIDNKDKFYWIHIYGMSLFAIKEFIPQLQQYAPNIILSVDSTKWTKCCNKKLHDKYVLPKNQLPDPTLGYVQSGICCNKANRDEFFLEYVDEIRKNNINVLY